VSREILRVIGIDPGTETSGYGVIESDGHNHKLIECAAIRAPARKVEFAQRLLLVCQQFEEVIERLGPQACAIEETFCSINAKSALKLGHVRGALLVVAARAGLPVFEYTPLEIKRALVGYGRAEKRQVQEMVRILLGLKQPPEPLDASDALAVAICHVHTRLTRSRWQPS
jgi:crossover junction endodeoxyribonuclease RuvC